METMFFLLPDPEQEILSLDETEEESMYAIHIGITGSPGYRITLALDRDLAENMAETLLEDGDSGMNSETVFKCLKETVNIVAGNFLLRFEGETDRNITLPVKRKEDVFDEDNTQITRTDVLKLYFEGKPLTAILESCE